MGILDDVVVNVKSAAGVVGKKAGQIVDVSKLRINISEVNGEISKKFRQLGEYVYENKKEGEIDETEIDARIVEIDEQYTQLEELTNQMASLQNKVSCPVCRKQCSSEASYCSACGGALKND